MYGFGWHEVFQSAAVRDSYSLRNSSSTYSGMETKIVYAVGCVSMVFVAIYAIIICVVNTLRTNYRNRSVAPEVDNRNDVSHVRLNKDLHNIWQSFVVTEMHAGSSRCDILSKQHQNIQQETISDERNDGPARKQPVDCQLLCLGKGETTQTQSKQACESFQAAAFSEDAQGSSLARGFEASPTMKVRHTSLSREHLLAFPLTEYLQVFRVKESLKPQVDIGLQTFSAVEVHQKNAAIECHQTSATIENLETSAVIENLQTSATIENLQTSVSIKDLHTYATIENFQTSLSIEDLQTSASTENLPTPASTEDFQTSAAVEGLQTSTVVENLETLAAIKGIQTFTAEDIQIPEARDLHKPTASESLQAPVVKEDLRTSTAVEDLQTQTANKGVKTSRTKEEFHASTSIEGFRLPPTSEDRTSFPAIEVPQISSDSGFPLTSIGTAGPLTPPFTEYRRTVVSNSHLYPFTFHESTHGHDQGSQSRLLNKLWPRNMFPLPRPSPGFAISNKAPDNLHLAEASTDSDYSEPLFRLQNNVHII